MTASGTAGHGAELAAYLDLAALGAVVVKSVSAEPWAGNPAPRLYPVEGGMLNSVGLQNPGWPPGWPRTCPPLAATGATGRGQHLGLHGRGLREAAAACAAAREHAARRDRAVVAVEANISCPNIEDRQPHVRPQPRRRPPADRRRQPAAWPGTCPLWAKLSPNVTDLPDLAAAAVEAGAAGRHPDQHGHGPGPRPGHGPPPPGRAAGADCPDRPSIRSPCGPSTSAGPPSRDVPIVGVGGVTGGETAAELLAAGADAVQVGTATFADPRAPGRVAAPSWRPGAPATESRPSTS